jgi:hypothetical protein
MTCDRCKRKPSKSAGCPKKCSDRDLAIYIGRPAEHVRRLIVDLFKAGK